MSQKDWNISLKNGMKPPTQAEMPGAMLAVNGYSQDSSVQASGGVSFSESAIQIMILTTKARISRLKLGELVPN